MAHNHSIAFILIYRQHQILVDDIEKSVDDISDGSYTCYSPIPPVYSPISSPVTHDQYASYLNYFNYSSLFVALILVKHTQSTVRIQILSN